MQSRLKVLAIGILGFVGVAALGGGIMLVLDPSGQSMQIPIDFLHETVFDDYFIPGLVLTLFIGVLNLITAALTYRRSVLSSILVFVQGAVLFSWLSIELMINVAFYVPYFHIPLYILSILLMLIGIVMRVPNNKIAGNHQR